MAIFHLDLRHLKRQTKSGKIKSVKAIVAYRERCQIDNFNYSKKTDFITSFSLFPAEFSNTDFAQKMSDPVLFSNEIESVEKRRDAQLFDELILALPHELTVEQNQAIITQLLQHFYIGPRNQMAKVCIHRTKSNLHAHVLIPQRPLERTPNGIAFGKKIREEFGRGKKPKNTDRVTEMRERWAELVNKSLSEVGENKRISHLSLKELRKEAERVFDFKAMELYDRSPLYLPVSAYKRTEFIVSENDRFAIDFQVMHRSRTFAARRAEPETLTLEELRAEQEFWQKLKEENRLRSGSIQLARKFAKRAEKQIFLKNEITNLFEKTKNETTRNIERGFENAKTSDSRAVRYTTSPFVSGAITTEYFGFNPDRTGNEVCKRNVSSYVSGRPNNSRGGIGRHERNELGFKNSSRISRIGFKEQGSNSSFVGKRKIHNSFANCWDRQGEYGSFSNSFESSTACTKSKKSEREKDYRRNLSLVPRRRRRVS